MVRIGWSIALWMLAVTSAQAAPITYALDNSASQLVVRIYKEKGALAEMAHDHAILATGWSGTATLDIDEAGAVQSCDVSVTVPVHGLRPDVPSLRESLGMTVMLTDAQQAQIKKHMLGDDQLDGSSFPQITFTSKSCSGTISAMEVRGMFSVRGQSKPVAITLKGSTTDGTLKASGGFSAAHSDFGFEPYSAFMGTLKNQQVMKFIIDLNGKAQ